MPPLPPEIWIAIAEFIEATELENLFAVNRVFFELAMNARYREIHLVESDASLFFQKIGKLRHTAYSSRVRVLHIWPVATWHAIRANPASFQYVTPTSRGKLRLLRAFRDYLGIKSIQAEPLAVLTAEPFTMTPEDRHITVASVANNLVNVGELHVHWQGNLSTLGNPCCPLLDAFLSVSGSKLRSLSLDVPSTIIRSFIPSSAGLTVLQELDIRFTMVGRHYGVDPSAMTALTSFINELSSTLRSLAITIYSHVDISYLFKKLGHFPCLVYLSLTMPIDVGHSSDPSVFNQFLSKHKCLQSLCIKPCVCWCAPRPMFSGDVENWFRQCFLGVSFENLRKFELGLKNPPWVRKQAFDLLKPLCQNLTSLTIVEHRLSFGEVKMVINSLFTRSIKILSLFTQNLSPDLFDFLAENCVALNRLVLDVEHVCHSEGIATLDDTAQFCIAMRKRRITRKTLYGSWKLNDLEIWRWEYRVGRRQQWNCMRAIAQSVHAIHTCGGQEHMRDLFEDEVPSLEES